MVPIPAFRTRSPRGRPALPCAALAALAVLGTAGCDPTGDGGGAAAVDAGAAPAPGLVSVGTGEAVPSAGTPVAPAPVVDETPPVSSSGAPQRDAVFDLAIADLGTVALELRRRVLATSRAALVKLNEDFVAGTLSETAYECAGSDYPVTGYYCGGENGGDELLEGSGTPIAAFAFLDDTICRDALSSGADAAVCAVEYAELVFPSDHDVRYRVRFVDGAPVETLDIISGESDDTELAIDPELGGSLCKITIVGTSIDYSDEAYCDESAREVLAP